MERKLAIFEPLVPDKKLSFETREIEIVMTKCQGGQPVAFRAFVLYWGGETAKDQLAAGITTNKEGDSLYRGKILPNFALVLDHPTLKKAVQGLREIGNLERAAEEIIDKKCQGLDCRGGENCALRGTSKKKG